MSTGENNKKPQRETKPLANLQKRLTEQELREFKEIFDLVDRDGGGTISRDELQNLMDTLGVKPSEEQLDQMMAEVDTDGSGDIDFKEFVQVMSRKIETDYTPAELKKAFSVFHTKDMEEGFVKTEVLERAMTTYEKLPIEEAAKLLAAIDPDNTGKINYMDYIKMMSLNN